jgi:hypothetical protein
VAAFDVPGSDGKVRAGGWLDGLAVAGTEDGPRQRPQALLALRVDGRATRALSGHLELRARVGGPFEGGHPGFLNLVHTYQNRSPAAEVNEAYVDVRGGRADLRAGVQRLAWGKLDGIPPTDVVNPRDFHDPLVQDVEERKIGVPALLGTYYLPALPRLALDGLRASLVCVPFAVPSRLPLIEERWFPGTTIVGSQLSLSRSEARQLFGQDVGRQVIPLSFRTRNHRPPLRLDAGGIGLRFGGTWRDTDFDLYHYSGAEAGPDLDLRSYLVSQPRYVGPHNPLGLSSINHFRQAHDVMHMVGADAATALGGATVRAEAAYFRDRPFLRLASRLITPQELARLPAARILDQLSKNRQAVVPLGDLFVDLDAFEWGVGIDYLWHGFLPLFQVSQVVLLEPAADLAIADPETRFTASLRRSFLGERLELEVRGIYTLDRESWFVLPRVSYVLWDALRLRLGYLAIGGPQESLIGQYKENDEVVLQARYSF